MQKSKQKIRLWKSLYPGLMSKHGDHRWEIGKWYKVGGPVVACKSGFHASENIIDAMGYVAAAHLAEVEVQGVRVGEDNKQAWSEMRLLRAWDWGKEDSVRLAIFAAELVLKNYEDKYPEDDRPRKAIEAARAYLEQPSNKTQSAAESAAWSAARSAESAERSAESAAWSAERSAESAAWSAARSAESAAWSVAESAESAARSAESAARSAESAARSAESDIKQKCHDFVLAILTEKKPHP